MPYMQRLGHIGSAVVDDDLFRLFGKRHAEPAVGFHFVQIRLEETFLDIQVQKAGLYDFRL